MLPEEWTLEYVAFGLLVLYLAPWILSEVREHENRGAILALTLATGWTGIGWLGALWWAGAPARADARRAPPALHVIAAPVAARTPGAGRSRRVRLAAAAVVLAAAGWLWLRPAVDGDMRREVVSAAGLELRDAPDAARPAVARLPAGCVVVRLEQRGAWRRLWRTADCPGASGRSSGWSR